MPISQRRIDAARANGAKSNGPRTPAGKAVSALNAVTHGLTARTLVLSNESDQRYQADLDQYLSHFQPQGKPETDLVHQLAATHWRLCRYAAIESRILDRQMDRDRDWIADRPEIPEAHRLAIAFDHQCGPNSALALLNRYDARLHREYRETLKLLEKMQAAREARRRKLPNEPKPVPSPSTDQTHEFPNLQPLNEQPQSRTHHSRPNASSTFPGIPPFLGYPELMNTMPFTTTAPGPSMEPPLALTPFTV